MQSTFLVTLLCIICLSMSCNSDNQKPEAEQDPEPTSKIRVLLDTDANNELDDQHAIAYLLFNGDVFETEGITVNRTRGGGGVDKHQEEAERVVQLANLSGLMPVYKGASASFDSIPAPLQEPNFDGAEAVNFIIEQAKAATDKPLVLLPVGKLTNIALALAKEPSIAKNVRIVWLGSNYPEPGEYNLENDTASLNYILDTEAPFEMVTVRYGGPSGSAAVRVTPQEMKERMTGKGPKIVQAVSGRHGETFTTFGDYAINLFEHIHLDGDPPGRALYDVVAVAVVKNPAWGQAKEIPAPKLVNNVWVERPNNERKITVWENFDTQAILDDFFGTMENYVLIK